MGRKDLIKKILFKKIVGVADCFAAWDNAFSRSIKKDFVGEKKIRNRKKKEPQEQFFKMKLNTKPLKFKCGPADGGGAGGRAGPPMQGMGTPT